MIILEYVLSFLLIHKKLQKFSKIPTEKNIQILQNPPQILENLHKYTKKIA